MRELGAVAINNFFSNTDDIVKGIAEMFAFVCIIAVIVILIVILCIRSEVADRRERKAKAEEETAKQEASRQAQAETEARIEKYATTTVARTVAENLVKLMHDSVDREIRDIRESEVRCNIRVSSSERQVNVWVDNDPVSIIFSFFSDNLQPPEFPTEFICAVCSLAIEMYKVRYPRDKSGTSYSLNFSKFCEGSYFIKYTAPNGFYVPPKSW